jgi:hypothetical protein
LVGVVAWLAVVGGAGFLLGRHDADPRYSPVPELRFAGSDLVYVFRRVAAEGGVLLALDELRPLDRTEDLRLLHVDVDLPGGTLEGALDALQEQVGGFEYSLLENRLLYVRSYRVKESKTALDRKDLPGGTFEGDLQGLGDWLLEVQPEAFLRVHLERGHPVGPPVEMVVPKGSSALDALLLYAQASGVGWRLRRAGQHVSDSEAELVVVATEVTPWKPLDAAHHTPSIRMEGSMVQAFADIEVRLGTPICVIDPSPLYGNRGTLDRAFGIDPALPIEHALDDLSQQAGYVFRWEKGGGLYVVWAEGFDRFPWLGDILKEELRGGEFRGTLFELTRWLNTNRRPSSDRDIVGGEIVPGLPAASISVREGATVGEVLFEFARQTNRGWYLVIYDRLDPEKQTEGWRGAFLSELVEWSDVPTPW